MTEGYDYIIIGGGSAGDATVILEELIDQDADGWAMAIYDPECVKICFQAGIGAEVDLRVGGKTDTLHGPTLAIRGRVRMLCDGKYEETERRHGGGRYFDQGLSAVIEVPKHSDPKKRGGLLLLNSKRTPPMSIHQLTCAGIVPMQQRILVAKGSVAPRAAYEPVSAQIIPVDSAGACSISRPPSEFKLARRRFMNGRRGEGVVGRWGDKVQAAIPAACTFGVSYPVFVIALLE